MRELAHENEPEQDEPAEVETVDDDPDELAIDPEVEPESEPEATARPGDEDGANEENYRALDRKADNYFKGLAKIVEGTGIPLVPCELCANAYPGVRWTEPQDDPTRAMLGIIGATESGSPLLDDPDAELCNRCNGFGWTKLPAHVPGNTERLCRQCNGAGWLDRSSASGALVAPTPEPVNGQTEVMAGVPEDDPSVTDLRARGYTIIPPIQLGTQEQPGGVPQP